MLINEIILRRTTPVEINSFYQLSYIINLIEKFKQIKHFPWYQSNIMLTNVLNSYLDTSLHTSTIKKFIK